MKKETLKELLKLKEDIKKSSSQYMSEYIEKLDLITRIDNIIIQDLTTEDLRGEEYELTNIIK